MSQGTKAADLLQWFRALGGVADNVQLRQGPHGWGLFVVDPEQPVRVFEQYNRCNLTPSLLPAPLNIRPQGFALPSDSGTDVDPILRTVTP